MDITEDNKLLNKNVRILKFIKEVFFMLVEYILVVK